MSISTHYITDYYPSIHRSYTTKTKEENIFVLYFIITHDTPFCVFLLSHYIHSGKTKKYSIHINMNRILKLFVGKFLTLYLYFHLYNRLSFFIRSFNTTPNHMTSLSLILLMGIIDVWPLILRNDGVRTLLVDVIIYTCEEHSLFYKFFHVLKILTIMSQSTNQNETLLSDQPPASRQFASLLLEQNINVFPTKILTSYLYFHN